MSASTAIGMVGQSLQAFLEADMELLPAVDVTLLAPDEPSTSTRRINLWLCEIRENAHLRNKEWEVSRTDPTRLTPPPLSLNLLYLMTPFAQSDPQFGNTTAHEILGEAMRVFHQTPVVPEAHLVPGLQDAREQVKIVPSQVDLDELSQLWSTFSEPFRLSVLYEVSVVQLDQTPAAERTMAQRVTTVGVPDVRAPFKPPVVDRIEPASGPAGTVVTFSGEDLHDWRAYVSMSGQSVEGGLDIVGDSFTATIPAGLPLGFHRIRVDVSHLFRRTFHFEVTS